MAEIKSYYPAWAEGKSSIYNLFLRRTIRPETERRRFGTFDDLKWKVGQLRQELGYDIGLLMPILDPAAYDIRISDSPFAVKSMFAIDPRHLNIDTIPYFGSNTTAKFVEFYTDPQKPDGYDSVLRDQKMREYAAIRAMNYILYPHLSYLDEVADAFKTGRRDKDIYRVMYELSMFEQYYAQKQLREAISYSESIGFNLLLDMPGLRTVIGSDAIFTPEMFVRNLHGQPLNAGWNLEDPDPAKRQVWEMLARFDLDFMRRTNYEAVLEPYRYWSNMGFRGFRGDAWHFWYEGGKEGWWDTVAQFCRSNDLLFLAETGGALNQAEVDLRCRALGNIIITMPYIDINQGVHPTPRSLKAFIDSNNQSPTANIATTHDTPMIPQQYAAMFGYTDKPEVVAAGVHTLFSMASSWWAVFQDDEFVNSRVVQHPGSDSPWEGGAEETPYDISDLLKKLNSIRHRNPFMMDSQNIAWYGTSFVNEDEAGILAFARMSKDGQQSVVTLVNLRGFSRSGKVYPDFGSLGIDISQPFTLRDSSSDQDIHFIPGVNVFEDGSIHYELEPGKAHIFEIRRKD